MEKQQRKDRLVSRLYYMSAGMLIVSVACVIMIAGYDICSKKRSDKFNSMPNHTTGYAMPVTMRVMTYDSIINYHTSSGSGSIIIQDGISGGFSRPKIDTILHDPSYTKTIIRQTKRVRSESSFDANVGKIKLSPTGTEAYIIIKPDNIWLTMVLAVRNYSLLLCIVFILFQLTRLFKKLKNDLSFNSSLSRTIWMIGNCLLVYQLQLLITGALVMRYIDAVTYYHETEGTPKGEQVLSLDISYGGSFIMIFTGLSLVVLSKLLNYGYELQQENELTI